MATPYGVSVRVAGCEASRPSVCTVTMKGTDLLMMGRLAVPPAVMLVSTWPQ